MAGITTKTMRILNMRQAARLKNMMRSKHFQPDHRPTGLSTTVKGDTLVLVKSTDHLDLSQTVPELAAVPAEHSGYTIKLTSEIERDTWLGEKHLDFLLAELLLQHSSKAERQTVLDVRYTELKPELEVANVSR